MELDFKVEKGLLSILPLHVFVHSIALYNIQALIPQGRRRMRIENIDTHFRVVFIFAWGSTLVSLYLSTNYHFCNAELIDAHASYRPGPSAAKHEGTE